MITVFLKFYLYIFLEHKEKNNYKMYKFCEISKVVKLTEAESRSVVARGRRSVKWVAVLNEFKILVTKVKKF